MMKKILLLIILGTIGINSYAQPTAFSQDSVKFLKQIIDFIGDEDKTTAKEFKEKFEPIWLSDFTRSQRFLVYKIANGMLGKGYRPFPEFYDFLQSLYGFKVTNQPESSFNAWSEMLGKLLVAKERKQLPDFLKMSGGLFTQGIIFETNAVKWRCRSKNYKFEYDKQPRVVFEHLDFICYTKGDSSVIYNTSGVYSPISSSWEGKGGKVTWLRAGLDTTQTYAIIKRYKAMLKTPGFDADSVLFYTPYFKKPLAGDLSEKVLSVSKTVGVRYPQFNSYSKRLFIKDFYPGVDYEGGFTVQGSDIVGSGTTQQLAKLIFYRNGKKFLKVGATNLILNSEDVTTERSVITFYIENDSIYHPGINFKYITKDNQVTMIRQGQGIVMSPFYDSYHKLEISSEAVYWRLDEPVIEFAPLYGSSKTDATLSSYNYFIPQLYDLLQGQGNKNPLYPIYELTIRKDTMILPVGEVATYMGLITDDPGTMSLFYELTTLGLISFDNESGMITVKPKLKDFTDARAKKKDYDPIIFESDLKGANISARMSELNHEIKELDYNIERMKKAGNNTAELEKQKEQAQKEQKELIDALNNKKSSNATLNLSNLDLLIRGVTRVNLSDSQIVRVFPYTQEIVVKKNRDFVFSGVVNAGSTEFFGKNLSYEYAENKINLPQADSMRLRVFPIGAKGNRQQIRVTSVIKNVRGTIFIDLKDNKAGNKKGNGNYPYLDCIKDSYVYYNKKSTYGGVYDSSKFFFKIAPFKMDSLDNFKASGVNFAGDFYSAGILPTIKESLRVQKDYSLGFIRKAPPEGFSLYGDKAKFNNDIRLSDKGLQADGELNYLTSFAQSKDFVLFPDSITGVCQTYENRESLGKKAGELNVPKVTGKEVYVCFVPKQKIFYASTIDASMKTHNDQADYRGKLILRPDGLTARGKFFFNNAEMKGKLMKLKSTTIDCDTASFKLKSADDKNAVALKTENVNAHIDFTLRNGEFKSNGSESFVEFPENQYVCYMDRFKWFMDNEDIELASDKKGTADINIESDLDLSGSNFFSTRKDQDSLNFMAPKAKYDIRKKIIRCEKVEYITVADARIYPDSAKITIRKEANIDELLNAKIIANYITKYHSIFNAKAKITAKRKYMASGDYTYRDENNYEQKIHFENIYPDSTFSTFARGEVLESEKFALSPNFEYKGKVVLKAEDIGLNFDGYTRIAHKCSTLPKNWFAFKAVIDPKDIVIPVSKDLLSDTKRSLGSGIYLNLDTTEVYPYAAFLSEKQNPKNPSILSVDGKLIFDKLSQEYRIGSTDKLKELSLPGNYISIKKAGCNMFGDGKFVFFNDPNVFKVSTIGSFTTAKDSTKIKASMLIDFPFNEGVLEKFAEQINEFPDLVPVEIDKTPYAKALRELLPLEKADKVLQDINLYGELRKGYDEIKKAIFITDITFKWNPLTLSYVSKGKIGVGHMFRKEVFKYIDGVIEIKKTKKEDIISVFLQIEETKFFYFTYSTRTGIADAYFSDESLTTTIQETKADKLKTKGEKGEKDYEYRAGSKSKAFAFRNSME